MKGKEESYKRGTFAKLDLGITHCPKVGLVGEAWLGHCMGSAPGEQDLVEQKVEL